jgi:hypothetical protein
MFDETNTVHGALETAVEAGMVFSFPFKGKAGMGMGLQNTEGRKTSGGKAKLHPGTQNAFFGLKVMSGGIAAGLIGIFFSRGECNAANHQY